MSRCLIFNYACCQSLVNNNSFTQWSSCIGRLQEKMCKSICSSIKCYIFRSLWCECVATWWNNLPIYGRIHLIVILAAAVLANHSPGIHIQVSAWNHPGWLESVHGNNALGNNFNGWCNQAHVHLAITVM